MKFRSILPLLLLAMQSVLPGQDGLPALRKGEEALTAGLWEMAALHFNEGLSSKTLSASDKSLLAIRLAEAWIRDGKPAEALDWLGQSFVTQHPEAPFWKGQALVGLGRFAEAISTLSPLLKPVDGPHRQEAGFTVANLQLALDQPDEALITLSSLARSDDPALRTSARLREVQILLNLMRYKEAREIMPDPEAVSQAERPLATFLEAHLLLAEGRPADAASSFQTLVDQPQGQTLYRYHLAAIGLADALRARKDGDASSAFLLSFIQDHPDSPLLDAMFRRLLDGLPETPTLTDPVLDRLSQWITPSELPTTGLIASQEGGAAAAWPNSSSSGELLAYSLYARAMGLGRIDLPEARAEATRLLTRLRLENPNHLLAGRALFETARLALKDHSIDRALSILGSLRETANSPVMRGEAAFIEAQTAYSQGDKPNAVRLFETASKTLSDQESRISRFNAAIIRLTETIATNQPDTGPANTEDRVLSTELELERALSSGSPQDAVKAINQFLTKHPDHPRAPEARLAAAEASLAGASPDLSFARAQLDTLAAEPEKSANLNPLRIALVKLRILDLSKDPAATIATAKSIIAQYPAEPAAAEATFLLGRNLFQTRNYNDARIILEKLASTDTDQGRAQAAWLLAARSAALVPTSQSQQEALGLFDKSIESKGAVASIARLEKSRLMIDMNRLAEAATYLRDWFQSIPETDPLHLGAGLLLGEAIYAQGSINANSLTEALAIYDKLLLHSEKDPAVFDRLQYLRGRTLEQIPDEKDPSRKREKQAFIAYYSVLESNTVPAEWHYFELCGFRALALLERAERWPAAIACAKKIASFKGPRAEEAITRAKQLQLKHMIWED